MPVNLCTLSFSSLEWSNYLFRGKERSKNTLERDAGKEISLLKEELMVGNAFVSIAFRSHSHGELCGALSFRGLKGTNRNKFIG